VVGMKNLVKKTLIVGSIPLDYANNHRGQAWRWLYESKHLQIFKSISSANQHQDRGITPSKSRIQNSGEKAKAPEVESRRGGEEMSLLVYLEPWWQYFCHF